MPVLPVAPASRHRPRRRASPPQEPAGANRTRPFQKRVCVLIATNVGGTWAVPTIRSLVEAGHRVLVVTSDEAGPLAGLVRDAGATVVQRRFVGPWQRGWLAAFRALRADVQDFGADTLLYYLYLSALLGRAVGFSLRIPRVHFMVSPLVLETPPLSWAERLLVPLDSRVIAGSEAIRLALAALGRRRHVTVVYPPIDTSRLRPPGAQARREARERLGIAPGAFVAVMVAYWYSPRKAFRLSQSLKGHEVALEGWRLSDPGPDDRLFVVGGGFREEGQRRRDAFLAAYDHLGNPTVRFVDHTEDVGSYYAAADVSLSPSAAENLGAAAEASVAGVPTIATRVGALPEIVVPGISGWLVPERTSRCLAEAVVDSRLARDDGRLARFSENARRMAERMLDQRRNADASAGVVLGLPEAPVPLAGAAAP